MSGDKKFQTRNRASAKVTVLMVQDMREAYARGYATQGDLAREYNLSVIQVGRILRRESWQDVPERRDPHEMERALKAALEAQNSMNQTVGDAALAELDRIGDKGDTLE